MRVAGIITIEMKKKLFPVCRYIFLFLEFDWNLMFSMALIFVREFLIHSCTVDFRFLFRWPLYFICRFFFWISETKKKQVVFLTVSMIPFLFRRYDALNEMEFNFNESTILNEKLQQITDKTKRNKTKKNS